MALGAWGWPALLLAVAAGEAGPKRPLPEALRTGFHLSPLRPHAMTGEDFKPTSTREFLDLMKHSTPFSEGVEQGEVGNPSSWVSYGVPEDMRVTFRPDGYPTRLRNFLQYGKTRQMSVKATIGEGGSFVEDGEYVATWEGIGNISFEGDAQLLNASATTASVLVRPQRGIIVRIIGTSEADPLRGLKLVPAAFAQEASSRTFHPKFLQLLEGAAVLRFTGWQQIDAWDQESSLERQWGNRSLPTDQTQAGRLGVCVEHMVELANLVGAHPWFSMPRAANAGPGVVDPYASNFASLVQSSLRGELRVYVEYRSCCINGLAPGWDSQENAVQSLTAWSSWEAAWDDAGRLVNLISSLQQIDKFGSDIVRVEAAGIDAAFGPLCTYGETPCVAYDAVEAPSTYGNSTPESLVDEVLLPAMFKREAEVNNAVQRALYNGLEVVAFNTLPLVAARSYGHRGTLNWALQCEGCLMDKRGRRYGFQGRANHTVGGYVLEADFSALFAYQGLSAEDRVSGEFWLRGTPEQAQARCDGLADCAGFLYVKAGEWSCGTVQNRYGDCAQPGASYFFNGRRGGHGGKNPPTSCSAYTVPGTENCSPGKVDTYFKVDWRSQAVQEVLEEEALGNCSVCQHSFGQHWYTWEVPPEGFTLDRLHGALPQLIANAAGEQALEQKMVEALQSDSVAMLMLDYLERLRHLGFSTVVGGPMHRTLRPCRTGGKACGAGAMMTHPDDDGPVRRAFTAYAQGLRASAPTLPPPEAACPRSCIHGVCEGGSCRCWARASGSDCAVLEPAAPCGRRLGLSVSGVNYWTREWIFVDVFKHVGDWTPNQFTSYSWGAGGELALRDDGYPAFLTVNQGAQVLTVRDVEQHYTGGWYVVLYDGEGVLDFNMDVTAVKRVARGKIMVYVALRTGANNGLGLRISHTREDSPVRNIRVVTPGFEETFSTSPFHPAFLASLGRFSVLRFMDWMHANNEGTPSTWAERSTPSYFSQGVSKGVSLEYMVLLSNEVAVSPWFSLPINADDEYIGNFTNYVAQHLRPDLDVYMELGNEAWHTGFFGGQWAQQQGAAIGLSMFCWYAKRTSEMAAIARVALGPSRRLVVVAGSQASNADATRQLLACEGIDSADAIGLGPYFDGYGLLQGPSISLDAVLTSYAAEISTALDQVGQHRAVLNGTKFQLLAYEAGPGGQGDGSSNDLAIQAHRHPRMRGILLDYLQRMGEALDLTVYFASCGKPSKYGSWGLIEAMDQPRDEAVKYLAVQDFLDAGSTCGAAATCEASDSCSGKGICGTDDTCYCYRGYSGATCLSASFTDYLACGYRCEFDQGACAVSQVLGNLRSWACQCHPDYTGATCSRFDCEAGCNQRGHCIASGVCSCFRGYKGESCEVDCGCDHHGQCDASGQCICDRGWRRSSEGGCEWDCGTADGVGCVGPGQNGCSDCQMGTCVDGVCRCWAGYRGESCAEPDASLQANAGSAFGINVALSPSTFVDVMKTTGGWTSVWKDDTFAGQFSYQGNSILWENRQYEWGNGQEIVQGDDGYIRSLAPNQAVIILALRDVCLHAPDGRYIVTYDGDGELDFGMDASPAAFQKGRIDVDFTPTCKRECWFDKKTWLPYCTDNGIAITLRRTNPENPLRNIRIVMPGFLATSEMEPFHPWFLKHLERFAFVRFMDWGRTNNDAFVERQPVPARFVRFTSLATTGSLSAAGGGAPRVSELLLRGATGALLSCNSSDAPGLCDGDPNTDWAPTQSRQAGESGGESVVVELRPGVALSSYMWVTSGWDRRVDPASWRLEASTDGQVWTLLDLRSTRQRVTYYRRRPAAFESPEAESWYPIRTPSDLLQWADRTLPTHRSQSVRPVALEYQVLLVNTLGAAPWICVHHLASDDYVRQEAAFWLNNLRPDVQLYVEHSNEVWNALFPQGRHATEKGTSLGLVDGTCKTNPEQCARVRYNARRSKEIFGIWAEVWGAARSRLKFVLSTQTVWQDVTRDLFSIPDGTGADVLGITAYMSPSPDVDESYSPKSPAEVIDLFRAGIDPSRGALRAQKALAAEYGVGLAVYEGGVGLVEQGTIESGQATGAVTDLLMATGRSPDFKAAVEDWLSMFREELGDSAGFGYFVDTGFWSKYGQWGMREYYDAATATSPAAAALHAHLDARYNPRPACVVANSWGRGLPPDSFFGPPAVKKPAPQSTLVVGKRYRMQWMGQRLPPGTLELHLWSGTSCEGAGTPLGSAPTTAASFVWEVPDVPEGSAYFVELRPTAPLPGPSNFSGFFSVVSAANAPLDYLLYVENDVDLLSAFQRDCKKGAEWALRPHFRIESCVYATAEGCREYRTSRKREALDGPPPWRHGSFKPLRDCTLHVVGLRQTLRLEGLTRGFDLAAADNLARIVANASMLPSNAVSISVLGAEPGRRLSSDVVTLDISIASDDNGLATAVRGFATLPENTVFAQVAASALGEVSLTVVGGNISTDDAASPLLVATTSLTSTTTQGALANATTTTAMETTTAEPSNTSTPLAKSTSTEPPTPTVSATTSFKFASNVTAMPTGNVTNAGRGAATPGCWLILWFALALGLNSLNAVLSEVRP